MLTFSWHTGVSYSSGQGPVHCLNLNVFPLLHFSSSVGTLKRRRAQASSSQTQPQRAHHRQPRDNYQMGQMRR